MNQTNPGSDNQARDKANGCGEDGSGSQRKKISSLYENTLSDVPLNVVLYFASDLVAGPLMTDPWIEKLEP